MKLIHLTSAAKRATLVVTLLGVLGIAAGIALAASAPPAPTITSHPASPTTSTSASFTLSDPQSGVTYLCSLDGSSYGSCPSQKSYSGLVAGTHTFSARAQDSHGHTSGTTSLTWTIDLSSPSTAIVFPAAGGLYNASGWSGGCDSTVCGAATDPAGVATVTVSIRQNSTGRYWNGSAYSSSIETYRTAQLVTLTSSTVIWFYPLPTPSPDGQYTIHVRSTDRLGNVTLASSPTTGAFTIDTTAPPAPSLTAKPVNPANQTNASFSFTDGEAGVGYLCRIDAAPFTQCSSPKSFSGLEEGAHTFSVEARDAAGNTSSSASYSWVIDTTPPPAPKITSSPSNPTTSTSAQFAFTDAESGVGFQCKLDAGIFAACSSPASYGNLGAGAHTFTLRATDAAGNTSKTTTYSWTINASSGMPFTITGNVPSPLYPGSAPQTIPLRITNPNSVPIYVTALTATVQATGATGCTAGWFQIVAAGIPPAGIPVAANSSITVPAANDPTLQMVESHTNQDACRSATLTLSYSGSAHS
jgi:large repetitive protein